MSYEIFIKELGSQESGYSGDKPNQRGKYILIPKNFYYVFPHLSTTTLNAQSVIRCKVQDGREVAVNIVYHNAKYFPEAALKRKHDEVRLYRSSKLDEALGLDRGVIVIATKLEDESFGFISVQKDDSNYKYWQSVANTAQQSKNLYDSIKDRSEIKQLVKINTTSFSGEIQNSMEAVDLYTKKLKETRRQQVDHIHDDDPARPIQSLFNSQDDFKNFLRTMYGGRCALRDTPLALDYYVGLEAAHIHPHSHKGPLLPTNGILLSKDLHAAFEHGFFTLSDDNKVMVSKKIESDSSLWKFNNKKIHPISTYEVFAPFRSYTQWHRDNKFETFESGKH